jgi:hypothetical protein
MYMQANEARNGILCNGYPEANTPDYIRLKDAEATMALYDKQMQDSVKVAKEFNRLADTSKSLAAAASVEPEGYMTKAAATQCRQYMLGDCIVQFQNARIKSTNLGIGPDGEISFHSTLQTLYPATLTLESLANELSKAWSTSTVSNHSCLNSM